MTFVPVKVSDEGKNEQFIFVNGRVPQARVTVPLYPPTGVRVSVLVPDEPLAILISLGEKAAERAGAVTDCAMVLEMDARKPFDPVNCA
jgi:hypothetical protein